MIDNEFKKQLIDRFTGDELCDYLQLTSEDVVEAFEDAILDAEDDLREFLQYGK